MRTNFFLVVNNRGSVKVKSRAFSLGFNEISINVNLDLPDALFKKPTLQCKVQVPDSAVNNPEIEMKVVDNIADAIRAATGFEAQVSLIPQPKE